MHSSKIYLNKTAYNQNIKFIRKLAGPKTIISSVVKGNAYGHGIKDFVPLAESCGVDHFSVFSQDEAYEVKKYCKNNSTIMIMGFLSFDRMDWIVKKDIEIFIFNYVRLERAIKSAKKLKKKIKIHIELETGLNRTGFSEKELSKLFEILKKNKKHITVKGLCTHFAGAENISNYYRIKKQMKYFNKSVELFKKNEIKYELLHAACSAAIVTFPKSRFNLVRIGVMQYGFWPTNETKMSYLVKRKRKTNPLKPILSWESEIMDIKSIKEGEYIGYSDYYMAQKNMLIATIPVGYAQGYSRSLSNNSWVIIRGELAEVVGVINMNLFQVDVSNILNVKIGDKVTLIGCSGDSNIGFTSFSDKKSSLNYEILTRIPEDIPRKTLEIKSVQSSKEKKTINTLYKTH